MFRSVTLLVLLGFIWGSGYSIARYAMTHGVQPFGYAFWQSWGPAILLFIFICLRKIKLHFSWRHIVYYIVTALLGIAIPNTTFYITAAHLPAGILAVVVNTVPLFAYPLALLVSQEKFSWLRVLGVALGIAGMMCIVLPKAALPGGQALPWALYTLIAPLSFALCAVFSSKFRPKNTDSLSLSMGMLLFSAIILTPIVFSIGQFYPLTGSFNLAKFVILLEILLSSVGYILFFELLRVAGPVYYSLVGGLVGLTGIFWGYVIFNERLNEWTSIAVLLILIAITLVTIKLKAYTHGKTSQQTRSQ
jgi:drug/metabolite transporter (DMT)-like permease